MTFNCAHCDRSYKDEKHYQKHLEQKHGDHQVAASEGDKVSSIDAAKVHLGGSEGCASVPRDPESVGYGFAAAYWSGRNRHRLNHSQAWQRACRETGNDLDEVVDASHRFARPDL